MKKKRILSLLLAVLMTCSVLIFSSCGEEEEVNDNYIYPKTVTLYSIRGEGTTDEAIALVEKALNAISKPKYKTAVKLVFYTEEEYDAVLSWMYLNGLEGFTQEAAAAQRAFIPDF